MSDRVRQQEDRDAEREAERIRTLLRRHGGRDYDALREQEHYEGGFVVEPRRNGAPPHVGGFHEDPFRVWPEKMRQHAETLTAHGYQVKVLEYFDGEILEVTPPAPRPRGEWLRRLFRG
jgi:hypothetical protein